jgi:hypothetical protein
VKHNMTVTLTKKQVSIEVSNWLKGDITSAQLAQWAQQHSDEWGEEELDFEDEELMSDILYRLRFADWLDSVPDEKKSDEADCSLSKEEAEQIITSLN